MSKIICDICGTSYPETAKRCPICGCIRPGDAQPVASESNGNGQVSGGYTYVKGGRFSKSNVKRRGQGSATVAVSSKGVSPKKNNNNDEPSNRGLVITAAILLLAIIIAVLYIAIRIFAPVSVPKETGDPTDGINQGATLPCEKITLDVESVVFQEAGEARMLDVRVSPANTTDKISFRSEDESVATVSDAGKITAVGSGTTKIIVTCGSITKECAVECQFNDPTGSETTPDVTDPTETTGPSETVRLNRMDMTLFYVGDSWVLYSGSVAKNLITWSSDDENVAIFTDGRVVAVGGGMTTVHAEYEGQKASCIVRCDFKSNPNVGGNGGVTEDGGDTGSGGVTEDGSGSTVITGYANVTDYVNIRSGPSTSFDDVGDLLANETVTITKTAKDAYGFTWGMIGDDQWVRMDYITITS